MRLAGVTVVKNEADIVETFVRHNLRFLDHLAILDHDSVDATGPILNELAAEGLPLTLFRSRALEFSHHELMQRQVAQVFRRHAPDFVFLLDANELIAAASRSALEASLARLPPATPGSLRWRTHLPSPGAGSLLQRMRRRPARETNAMRKIVLPNIAGLQGEWQIAPGNHAARHRAAGGWHQPELPDLDDVALAHLPLRSPGQALSKALIGWLGWRLRYADLDLLGAERMGWHWRQWSETFLRDGRWPGWDALRREALRVYAFDVESDAFDADGVELLDDPLPEPPGMRGLGPDEADPTRNLAAWGMALVDSIVIARRERRAVKAPR